MRRILLFSFGLAATGAAFAEFTPLTPANLADGGATLYGLIGESPVAGGSRSVLGDTYSAAPLVQDEASAFFLQDIDGPGPSTSGRYVATFDGAAEASGVNVATGNGFSIVEAQTDLGGGNFLVQVQYTAVDAAGNPEPWVPAGVTGPAGPFTSWRMDVGTTAAGSPINRIEPNNSFSVLNSGFTAFNSAGAALGTFALSLDDSNPPSGGLSGVAVVGLGGSDIAGVDLATMQMFWEINVVPEPAALGLLALGGLLAFRRR